MLEQAWKKAFNIGITGTVSPDFKAFYDLRYQICTFYVGVDSFKIFSFSGYINIWRWNFHVR
jgi:hypothetical protein